MPYRSAGPAPPPFARPASRRPGWAPGWALLASLALVPGLRAEDAGSPDGAPAPVLAQVQVDPSGRLTRLLAEAEEALAAAAPALARARLSTALAEGPDGLVPAPRGLEPEPGLSWPVRDAVELLAPRLPPEERAQLDAARREAREPGLVARVRQGDAEALAALARAPAISPAAREALLALAESEAERGRHARAARLLLRWLRASPDEAASIRARVALRAADGFARSGDVQGLRRLLASAEGALAAPVTVGGAPWTVKERAETHLLAGAASPDPVPSAPAPALPERLEPLLRVPLADPGLRGARSERAPVRAAATLAGPRLIVHAGRRIRCLDALSGREAWAFPPEALGFDHAPEAKYRPHDVPLRCVEVAGDLVLAVLGDPVASGTFAWLGQAVDVATGGRESRARLVALDLASGALRWWTGGAAEEHPVLGDPLTCVAGPPRVEGARLYVSFARRYGVAQHYAACLDLATGSPRWVSLLGTGESGRDPGTAPEEGRDTLIPVRAVPWAAAPALADDEVAFLPHAGLAAGVESHTGRVRWVRALPRYAPGTGGPATLLPPTRGHSGRNAPVPVPGTWALAPMDAPRLLGLEQGTGLLRWQAAELEGLPLWRDLLGAGRDARGRPVLRVVGEAPALLDASDGALLALGSPFRGSPDAPGRPLDAGASALRATADGLEALSWPGAPPGADGLVRCEEALEGGDLARAGPLWLCVSAQAVHVLAAASEREALWAAAASDPARSPAERRACRLARLAVAGSARELAEEARSAPLEAATGEILGQRLVERVERRLPGDADADALAALEGVAAALAPDQAAPVLHLLARRLLEERRPAELVGLLGRWLGLPPALLAVELPALGAEAAAEPPERGLVRSDLVAAWMLSRLRHDPAAAAALAAHDARLAAEVEAASSAPAGIAAPALEALARRAQGTPALTRLRESAFARASAEGRVEVAARLAADLRLDPPPDLPRAAEARRAWAGRWQLREAGLWAQAGEPGLARELLADLLRWGPSGLTDPAGRTASALAEELRRSTGFDVAAYAAPVQSVALWPEGVPKDRDDLRAVGLLGVEGPGAARWEGTLLVSRGLSLELWDAESGRRRASLAGDDEGWFGGSLQDVAPWLPEGGVRVVSLVAGQPADASGVFAGDWVTGWDGRALAGSADLMARLARAVPGVAVPVDVRRAGRRVLSALRPGRRPAAEGGNLVERARVSSDAAGGALVAARTGLDRVEPAGGARRAIWRHDGPGAVQRAHVLAGTAYVQVRRQNEGDLLVAVDPATGRERWRRPLDGVVAELELAGSAVVLEVEGPGTAVVLDAGDGSVRAVLPRAERALEALDRTRIRPRTAAASAGRLWWHRRRAWGHVDVDVADTTTLAVRPALRRTVPPDARALPPEISAAALVAVPLDGSHVLLLAPDPALPDRQTVMTLGGDRLLTNQDQHAGALSDESRVIVIGGTVFVVRNDDARPTGIVVMVFAEDRSRPGTLLFVDRARGMLPNVRQLILQEAERFPDGLLLTATTQQMAADGTHRRSTLWVPTAERGLDRDSGHRSWEVDLRMQWRRGAVRSGASILLPTDEGALRVPVLTAPDR